MNFFLNDISAIMDDSIANIDENSSNQEKKRVSKKSIKGFY